MLCYVMLCYDKSMHVPCVLYTTYIWRMFLFGAIGCKNKNRQNMKPRYTVSNESVTRT